MKQTIGIALAIGLFALGAWVILSVDDHHEHNHPHSDHDHDHHEEYGHNEELVAKEPVRADGEFTITTSFYPLQFALQWIASDLAIINNIGAGQDPHDFRPSTQNILALQQSDLVVLQGAEFEPWGDDVKTQLKQAEVPMVLATAELELREAGEDGHGHRGDDDHHNDEDKHEEDGHEDHSEEHDDHHGHDHGDFDPHTWLDPVLFSETVEHLTEALITLDPDNATTYEANAAALQTELAVLNTEYETTLATCQADEVITSHDAFSYLADRYDITIHTIAGISTQDTPSAQTLVELKEEAAEEVGAILLEENSVAAYGETLAAETGLQTLSINSIAYVIPQGADYLTLMRANLDILRTALNCNG